MRGVLLNFTSYGYNNPVKFIDPSGHCATDPYDEYYDYECWELVYQMQKDFGLSADFLGVLNLDQLQFFQGALTDLGNSNPDLYETTIQIIRDAVAGTEFMAALQNQIGWNVLGVRIPDIGVSAGIGINLSVDLIFNFDSLELSLGINLNLTAGLQVGGSGAGGVFLGFNAPTNDSFAGWGSGLAVGGAIEGVGLAVQYDLSNEIILFLGFSKDWINRKSDATYNLAIMYNAGLEFEASATLVGYSWIFQLYKW